MLFCFSGDPVRQLETGAQRRDLLGAGAAAGQGVVAVSRAGGGAAREPTLGDGLGPGKSVPRPRVRD